MHVVKGTLCQIEMVCGCIVNDISKYRNYTLNMFIERKIENQVKPFKKKKNTNV